MSTAPPFKALGAGNGLAGPIPKVIDGVTPYYFSGYASPLTYSLEDVMELFWLMEGASAGNAESWTWTVNTFSQAREDHPNLPASWTVATAPGHAQFHTRDEYGHSGGYNRYKPHERIISQGRTLLEGYNILHIGIPSNIGNFNYSEPPQNPYVAGSDGIEAHFSIGYGGAIQIVEDGTSNAKNRYGIFGGYAGIYGYQSCYGYFFSTYQYDRYYYMTTYSPGPGQADGPVDTISLGAFTLYGWHSYLQGGGGDIGSGTIPDKENTPTISAFEKYIIEE